MLLMLLFPLRGESSSIVRLRKFPMLLKQQFLFENGNAPCIHTETGAGVAWFIGNDTLTYKHR
jgi:hypothetical protein